MRMTIFSGGNGSENNPFIIANVQDLLNVRIKNKENPTLYYKQVDDIDLTDIEWEPIGNTMEGPPFMGHFDGGFNKIINLKISENAGDVGFFYYLIGANIRNVLIENATIYNAQRAGILACQAHNNTVITSCSVQGEIQSDAIDSYAAGLVETITDTEINKCASDVKIIADYAAALVVGAFDSTIKNSYARGTLYPVVKPNVGYFHFATFSYFTNNCEIEDCYAAVNMTRQIFTAVGASLYDYAHLFVEDYQNDGNTIKNCYCDTNVATHDSWIAGINYYRGILTGYPRNFVRGSDNNLYGLINTQIGRDYEYWEPEWDETGPPAWWPDLFYRARPSDGEVWHQYWVLLDEAVIPQARTTTQMLQKGNYVDWDFDNIWEWAEGDYPKLRFPRPHKMIKCKRMPLTNYRRR